MTDLNQRVESMYRSDVRGALILIALLWITILFVLFMAWPHIPLSSVKTIVLIAAAAVLLFNTAAIVAMIRNYRSDKEFIYTLDIKHLDAMRNRRI